MRPPLREAEFLKGKMAVGEFQALQLQRRVSFGLWVWGSATKMTFRLIVPSHLAKPTDV